MPYVYVQRQHDQWLGSRTGDTVPELTTAALATAAVDTPCFTSPSPTVAMTMEGNSTGSRTIWAGKEIASTVSCCNANEASRAVGADGTKSSPVFSCFGMPTSGEKWEKEAETLREWRRQELNVRQIWESAEERIMARGLNVSSYMLMIIPCAVSFHCRYVIVVRGREQSQRVAGDGLFGCVTGVRLTAATPVGLVKGSLSRRRCRKLFDRTTI